jgi:hypothetical protein
LDEHTSSLRQLPRPLQEKESKNKENATEDDLARPLRDIQRDEHRLQQHYGKRAGDTAGPTTSCDGSAQTPAAVLLLSMSPMSCAPSWRAASVTAQVRISPCCRSMAMWFL